MDRCSASQMSCDYTKHLKLSTADKPHSVRRTPDTPHTRLFYQHGHRLYGVGVMEASLKPPSRIDILQQAYEETGENLKELGARYSWVSVEDPWRPFVSAIKAKSFIVVESKLTRMRILRGRQSTSDGL